MFTSERVAQPPESANRTGHLEDHDEANMVLVLLPKQKDLEKLTQELGGRYCRATNWR